ncbi:C-type lectin domain family 4 member A-like isoform X2 [Cheilinus undulatus]|uniref:C-type lectin domain family 4 member A-like isoform X2 n=1 Tax=Cheilinus undulatus TaxID=241271 RepID=UPI001BD501EE|nr:C-type lectin domain family 4 member A-like isoform X2 [Cheilinus undulatus]
MLDDAEAAAGHSHFHVLPVCLGILCILLVICISAIIYISVTMNKQKAELERLKTERSVFENETQELSRAMDDLNWTLEAILSFDRFPVTEFCPEKKCQPCPKGWNLFQEKCYLFFNESGPQWKTWKKSQEYCQNKASDLVVIDSFEEQEFISKHIKFYHDEFHGFWLGLYESEDKVWQWLDGRNDTLRYWMPGPLGKLGPCALIIPQRNLTANWDPAEEEFLNKFICERQTLIRTN